MLSKKINAACAYFRPRDFRGNTGGALSLAWLALVEHPRSLKYCDTFEDGSSKSAYKFNNVQHNGCW